MATGGKGDRPEPEIDVEKLLRGMKYIHPSEDTLSEYVEGRMEDVGTALVEAHLKLCLVCKRRLQFLKEEREFVENYQITDEDRADARRFVEKLHREEE
jgi:hypothetical protein